MEKPRSTSNWRREQRNGNLSKASLENSHMRHLSTAVMIALGQGQSLPVRKADQLVLSQDARNTWTPENYNGGSKAIE